MIGPPKNKKVVKEVPYSVYDESPKKKDPKAMPHMNFTNKSSQTPEQEISFAEMQAMIIATAVSMSVTQSMSSVTASMMTQMMEHNRKMMQELVSDLKK